MRLSRSFWLLLAIGVTLRCVAINQPPLDAHLIRQCQTAAATQSLIEQGGFHLSTQIPWLGDMNAYYVLELPLYNYIVRALHAVVPDLTVSGKLVSLALWISSFLILQFIWRRFLQPDEAIWANVLFVLAPLSLFYAQAFMPEMLIQLLAFAFLLTILRYAEEPTLGRWSLCAALGALASVIKFPEVAHLYLVLAFVIFQRERWRALLRPRYVVAGIVTVAALKGWSVYVDSVNSHYLPEWTTASNVRGFIGPIASRFQLKPWLTAAGYIALFILPGPALLVAAAGIKRSLVRNRPLLVAWLLSIAVFYLVWFGNAGTSQSYYNLPAVAPLAALFGIGAGRFARAAASSLFARIAVGAGAALTIAVCVSGWVYLFTQDSVMRAASDWIKTNTAPDDVILFRPNHRWDFVLYQYNPVLAYCSGRKTFVWTSGTSEPVRELALRRCRYVVVTRQQQPAGVSRMMSRLRPQPWQPDPNDWLERSTFHLKVDDPKFQVFVHEPAS